LSFCLEDGTPLTDSAGHKDLQKTLVSPPPSVPGSVRGSGMPATQAYNLPGKATISSAQSQIPIAQMYGPATKKRKTWPWIVAILAVLFIVIVLVVLIAVGLPAMMRDSSNDNRPQPTPTQPADKATPTPGSSTSENDLPTDKDEVLAQLSKLEDEWEQANVKGDKEALAQILAEEYLGDGKTKRQYIDSLTPNNEVQSWEIQKLTVDQNGDRATVHGRLREETKGGPEVSDFTDEYVWRDHRWQAVSAHSSSVK
jgi:Domain of unknown function (DUF4440)